MKRKREKESNLHKLNQGVNNIHEPSKKIKKPELTLDYFENINYFKEVGGTFIKNPHFKLKITKERKTKFKDFNFTKLIQFFRFFWTSSIMDHILSKTNSKIPLLNK
jgi:uncharacterized protein YneR